MRDHIKILGIINMVLGALTALLGVIMLLAVGTVGGLIVSSLASSGAVDAQDRATMVPIFATVAVVVALFFVALGLPAILGGWGLVNFRPWSRVLMIVVSVFNLFHFPLGTLLGAYGLWVLLSDESRRILESGGAVAGHLPVAPGYYPAPRPPTV